MIRFFFSSIAAAAFAAAQVSAQVTVDIPDAAAALVAADAKVEKLGGDMKFVEGPVWIAEKKILVFSDIPASKLLQWAEGKGITEFRTSENANGNTLDREGRLLSAQHSGRNIVRTAADGTISVVVDKYEDRKFNSPNDLAVRKDGTIWFTDPPYGVPKGQQKEQDGNFVYRLDEKSGAVTIVSSEFDMPNGICFSPDHARIYIADSGSKQRVGAFEVKADGTLSKALWWSEGGADGIRCDEKGNLYTTAKDGVRIYSPEGKKIATIACPEHPANCAFGGEDGKTLFITARTGLYAVKLKVAGAK